MPPVAQVLPDSAPVSSRTLEIFRAEGNLPICTACATQYNSPQDSCVICDDPRQAVPASGQSWTSLNELRATRRNTILQDEEDERVKLIGVEPAFAINQTPFIIETEAGSYIWDCAGYISTALVEYLTTGLSSPLKAIAISHPHFFSSSLTWSRLLNVPLYINEADKEWYMRKNDIKEGEVIWWSGVREIGKGVQLIQCGGHFPGSSVLHWDRLQEPAPAQQSRRRIPVTGLLLTADTIMVQPTQRGFAFLWSFPNMIPLGPQDVISIQNTLANIPFAQASSTWPNRWIRENARELLVQSVATHLRFMGWEWNSEKGRLVGLSGGSVADDGQNGRNQEVSQSSATTGGGDGGGPRLVFSSLGG